MKKRIRAAREARAEKPYYKWIVLGTVVLSLLVILLDVTVVNVSIPKILTDFKTDLSNVQWVFNAYTLAFAALLITFGRFGDMFGHKRMFMLGLTLFGIASALSGAAPSIEWLIGFRVVQGIAGAMMMPATLSLMLQAFPPHQRGIALGFWGAMAGVAFAIGPVLGGFITDNFSWRWIFYINIPVVLFALLMTTLFIHQNRDSLVTHKIDVPGFVTVTGGLLALTFALIEGQKYGWGSPVIVGLFVSAAILLLLFVFVERRSPEPMIDIKLFKDRNFSIGSGIAALISFAMLGTFFLVPIFLQQILGFSATKTGLALTPMALAMLVLAPNVGRLSDKHGTRVFLVAGLSIITGAMFWLSHLTLETTSASLVLPFIVFGIGAAMVMPVMVNAAMQNVPENQYGAGSGVLNTARQLGGVFGIAIIGAIFSAQLAHHIPPALEANKNLPPQVSQAVAEQFNGGEIKLAQQAPAESSSDPAAAKRIGEELRKTIDPEVVDSVNGTFRFAMIFAFIGALLALFVKQPKHLTAKN